MGDNPYKAKDSGLMSLTETQHQKCRSVKEKKDEKKQFITVVGKDTVGIIAKVVLIWQTIR